MIGKGVERTNAIRAPLPAGRAEVQRTAQAAGLGTCLGFEAATGRLFKEIGCSRNELLPEGISAKGIGVRSGLR